MQEHKPVLIIIAGPNGSGKTTVTKKVLRHEWLEDCVYINPDDIAKEKFGDWNSPEAVLKSAKGKTFKTYISKVPNWAKGIYAD